MPVRLSDKHIGNLLVSEGRTQLVFAEDYWSDPRRPVLGLHFEDHPGVVEPWRTGLPVWFENIVPEGRLRDVVARTVDVDPYSSLRILQSIGIDLPGAVVLGAPFEAEAGTRDLMQSLPGNRESSKWNFSLAGYFLKLSVAKSQGRITTPAFGEYGNCILKFPSSGHPNLPLNEFWMMSLARHMGFDIPEFFLVPRKDLPENVSDDFWPDTENVGFGIVRFDRTEDGERIHMEDFAQILNKLPHEKYRSNFETVGRIASAVGCSDGTAEFVRRLTLNILIGNGDAHLKNWSVIYPDGRKPQLSPVYDLVCDGIYPGRHNLGMKFGGIDMFSAITRKTFEGASQRLGDAPEDVLDQVDQTCAAFEEAWADLNAEMPSEVREFVGRHSSAALLRLSKPA